MPPNKLNGGGAEVNGQCWEALLEQLRDAVAFVDRSGGILLTNRVEELPAPPPAVRMTELGETYEIFRPDGQPYQTTEWPVLRAARTGEVIVDEEFFRLLPDGSRRSFSCDCAPFYDDQGRISGAVLVARDISDQTRAQQQLAYLLPLLDYTEDAVVACDAGWHVTVWNRGAERLYGWSTAEALGRPATFLRLEESDEQRQERRRQLSENGGWCGELAAERKGGSLIPIEATGVAIRDPRGELTGYLGIHRDLTEHKRTDEQLRYHASLLDNVEDGVIVTDAEDFRITAWNRGAERLYGFSAEEVLGRPAREVASYPADQARLKLERELLDTGRTRVAFQAVRKDGSPIEVELVAVAVTDERGKSTGCLGIHRDITARQQTRRALEMRERQQSWLADLTLRNLADRDPEALLDDAAALVARALELDLASIGEKLPGEQRVAWRATYGWTEEASAQAPPSPADARSLVGYTLRAGEPVTSEDLRADGRFQISESFAKLRPVSAVAVVIPGEKAPFGVLVAAALQHRSFTAEDVHFVQAVANVIGVGAQRALITERIEEVREKLRVRIARDLHDDALRELADAVALAAIARSTAVTEGESARWDGLIGALERVGKHLRGAVYDLRLTDDEDRDFAALLSDLVDVQSGKTIGCRVELSGRGAIPAGSLGHRGTEVVRIVREAITNARVHSGATTIRVDTGGSTQELLRIEVSDDGEWPAREARAPARRGSGIVGMFERADELGAKLGIEGRPDGGTSVTLELPLGEEKADSR